MADFSNYSLSEIEQSPEGVFALAGGLLPEIARFVDFQVPRVPSEEVLRALISAIGPAKELQNNIELVQARLGGVDATPLAAEWAERSGALKPLSRAFRDETPLPEGPRSIVTTGGVARWMLRRRNVIEQLSPYVIDGDEIKQDVPVYLALGNRKMNESEHEILRTRRLQGYPDDITEADFGEDYVLASLESTSFANIEVVRADTANGDEVLDNLFDVHGEELVGGSIIVAANAPSAIQTAGQVLMAAQRFDSSFDTGEEPQLFVVSDTIQVARHGESAATHQNPYSALGQLARNALYLHLNSTIN